MEHTCYRCGQAVEEGVAFCPNCNAPQIRVAAPAENEAVTPPPTAGTLQPPAYATGPGSAQTSSAPSELNWHDAMPGILLAGVIIGLIMAFPIGAYLLWPVAAGVIAVFLYKRRNPVVEIPTGTGVKIGALAGLFSFVGFATLMSLELFAGGTGKFRQVIDQALQQAAARNPDPQTQQMMQNMATPAGVTVMLIIVFMVLLVMFVTLSCLGGVLGVKLLKKKQNPGV